MAISISSISSGLFAFCPSGPSASHEKPHSPPFGGSGVHFTWSFQPFFSAW